MSTRRPRKLIMMPNENGKRGNFQLIWSDGISRGEKKNLSSFQAIILSTVCLVSMTWVRSIFLVMFEWAVKAPLCLSFVGLLSISVVRICMSSCLLSLSFLWVSSGETSTNLFKLLEKVETQCRIWHCFEQWSKPVQVLCFSHFHLSFKNGYFV